MTRSTLRTADDCIRESLDAFMTGDKESAKEYLEDYLKFDMPDEEKDSIKAVIANISK